MFNMSLMAIGRKECRSVRSGLCVVAVEIRILRPHLIGSSFDPKRRRYPSKV